MIHLPFTSSVRGVSFYPENTSKVRVNGVVECIPDPLNEHDSNAIAVYHKGLHLGFLPAKLSATIMARTSDSNFKLMGVVTDKYFNGEFHALKVKISRLVTTKNVEKSLRPVSTTKASVKNSQPSEELEVSKVSTKTTPALAIPARQDKDIVTIPKEVSRESSELKSLSAGSALEDQVVLYNKSGRYLGKFKSIVNGMVLVECSNELQALYPITYVKYH